MKPCDVPCPKCGSEDISRIFYTRGDRIGNDEYGVPPCKWTSGDCFSYKAARDLIQHHCRCCQYEWVTKPLATPKRTARKPGDKHAS